MRSLKAKKLRKYVYKDQDYRDRKYRIAKDGQITADEKRHIYKGLKKLATYDYKK